MPFFIVFDNTSSVSASSHYVLDVSPSSGISISDGSVIGVDVPDVLSFTVLDKLLAPAPGRHVPDVPFAKKIRPNDHLLFTPSSLEPLIQELAPLRSQGIANLLRDYSDPRFVDTLISIADHGARIDYEDISSRRILRSNHRSAFLQADVVTKAIESELKKGRVKEIMVLPDHYFCSPIGLVPKMNDDIHTS